MATKTLQVSAMFVSHTRAAEAAAVGRSLDSGKHSHTSSNSRLTCWRIYYVPVLDIYFHLTFATMEQSRCYYHLHFPVEEAA